MSRPVADAVKPSIIELGNGHGWEEWNDDDEGEWISVHHSENEDEEEVWPGTSQNEDGVTTEQPDAGEEEGSEA